MNLLLCKIQTWNVPSAPVSRYMSKDWLYWYPYGYGKADAFCAYLTGIACAQVTVIVCVIALTMLLVSLLTFRRNPVYLLDFSVYKPPAWCVFHHVSYCILPLHHVRPLVFSFRNILLYFLLIALLTLFSHLQSIPIATSVTNNIVTVK